MAASAEIFFSKRYSLLDELGRGGMGAVYRARDRLSGQLVALKRVIRPDDDAEQPTAAIAAGSLAEVSAGAHSTQQADAAYTVSRMALANEFRTLASLRHPNIISVFDYGFDAAQHPFFTMELLAHPQSVTMASRDLSIADKVELLVQLLRALVYLHRRGILHRDLKPNNVLCIGSSVKVLDFGIAASMARSEELAGTIEYMAPELFLGRSPSVASDLYSAGVIAYEMLTGSFPVSRTSLTEMLDSPPEPKTINLTLHQSARAALSRGNQLLSARAPLQVGQLMAELTTHVGSELAAVVGKLLAQDLRERYDDATRALVELSAAAGRPAQVETATTRESFLQASQLVGRDYELDTLEGALDRACNSEGSCWLLGGESGVGKSRLLDEVRTQALVKGMLLLRGQAVSSGSAAYQVFFDVLRMLCLEVELTEFEASVLNAVVPNLASLLQQKVADAPELNAHATQARFLNVIEAVFARLQRPTAVVLEDLHWVGPETIALLERLGQRAGQLRLVLLGSFRDDEAKDLPKRLPEMNLLPLQRLSPERIAALSESMLGDVGNSPRLVEFLVNQTEGNAFFIVEVIRALAEEAGQLSDIGQRTLPARLLVGGIRQVVSRRLNRVPEWARPLLRLAAVMGRQLDTRALGLIFPKLDSLLDACADAAVLDISDAAWRFAHDKLRESLLEELTPEEARALHLKAARALEQAYPEDQGPVAALAHHYHHADELHKAYHFAVLAGERAAKSGALNEASVLLNQALSYEGRVQLPKLQKAYIQRLLLRAQFGQGSLRECVALHQSAVALLGHPLPSGDKLQLGIGTLAQLARQIGYRLTAAGRQPPSSEQQRQAVAECLLLHQDVIEAYGWLGQLVEAVYCTLDALNLSEYLQDRNHQATWSSIFAYLLGLIPLPQLSQYYLRKAQDLARDIDSERAQADILRISGLFQMHVAEWEAATETLKKGAALAHKIGDEPLYLFLMWQVVSVKLHTYEWDQALAVIAQLAEMCKKNHHHRYVAWFQATEGHILIRRGRWAEGEVKLLVASGLMSQSNDILLESFVGGVLAASALHRGDQKQARKWADETLNRFRGKGIPGHGGLEGFPSLVEVYLALWQKSHDPAERVELLAQLSRARRLMKQYGKVFKLGTARYHILEGQYHFHTGSLTKAVQHLQKGLESARRCRMRYDRGLAHFWLGQLASQKLIFRLSIDGRAHLRAAVALFAEIGAEEERAQAARALAR